MRRIDLEQRLAHLGWLPSEPSGASHVKWTHPRKTYAVYVRQDELLNNHTALRILADAGR